MMDIAWLECLSTVKCMFRYCPSCTSIRCAGLRNVTPDFNVGNSILVFELGQKRLRALLDGPAPAEVGTYIQFRFLHCSCVLTTAYRLWRYAIPEDERRNALRQATATTSIRDVSYESDVSRCQHGRRRMTFKKGINNWSKN